MGAGKGFILGIHLPSFGTTQPAGKGLVCRTLTRSLSDYTIRFHPNAPIKKTSSTRESCPDFSPATGPLVFFGEGRMDLESSDS